MLRDKKHLQEAENNENSASSSSTKITSDNAPKANPPKARISSPITFGSKPTAESPPKKRKFTPVVFDIIDEAEKSAQGSEENSGKRKYAPVVFDMDKSKAGLNDKEEPPSKKFVPVTFETKEKEDKGE